MQTNPIIASGGFRMQEETLKISLFGMKQDSQSKINCPVPASIQFLICDTGMKNITPLKMRKYRIVTAYCVRYGILLFVFDAPPCWITGAYKTRCARPTAEVNRPFATALPAQRIVLRPPPWPDHPVGC